MADFICGCTAIKVHEPTDCFTRRFLQEYICTDAFYVLIMGRISLQIRYLMPLVILHVFSPHTGNEIAQHAILDYATERGSFLRLFAKYRAAEIPRKRLHDTLTFKIALRLGKFRTDLYEEIVVPFPSDLQTLPFSWSDTAPKLDPKGAIFTLMIPVSSVVGATVTYPDGWKKFTTRVASAISPPSSTQK